MRKIIFFSLLICFFSHLSIAIEWSIVKEVIKSYEYYSRSIELFDLKDEKSFVLKLLKRFVDEKGIRKKNELYTELASHEEVFIQVSDKGMVRLLFSDDENLIFPCAVNQIEDDYRICFQKKGKAHKPFDRGYQIRVPFSMVDVDLYQKLANFQKYTFEEIVWHPSVFDTRPTKKQKRRQQEEDIDFQSILNGNPEEGENVYNSNWDVPYNTSQANGVFEMDQPYDDSTITFPEEWRNPFDDTFNHNKQDNGVVMPTPVWPTETYLGVPSYTWWLWSWKSETAFQFLKAYYKRYPTSAPSQKRN